MEFHWASKPMCKDNRLSNRTIQFKRTQKKIRPPWKSKGWKVGLPGLRFAGGTITPCLWGPNAQASLSGCLSLTCWAMGSELPSSSMRTKTSRVVVTTLSSWL